MNCVSRDNNNQHMAGRVVLGVKRARGPVENWPISGKQCQYLFYHSASVTNGSSKTRKDLGKGAIHSIGLFTSE